MCNKNNTISANMKINNQKTEKYVLLEFPYWVTNGNNCSSINYCKKCVTNAATNDNGIVDGGWSTEHDTPPYCDTCNTPLAGSLTDDNGTVIETLSQWQAYP
jgi:hypothetical protein